ncbi:hypothetical protein [Pseudoxanthomonas koreensis]|uniref:hypothetical protein n=1 Tax=Pseudoxanthomonas koreensis TaxID=266061 RepID=UPI001391360B|nr:hypothetical protein [Pseudoxanthomonas koreensis]
MNEHDTEVFFLPTDPEHRHPVTGAQILSAARAAFERAYVSACRQLAIQPGEHAERMGSITPDGTWMSATVTDGLGRKRTTASRVVYPGMDGVLH